VGINLSIVLNHYLEEFIPDDSIKFGIVSEEPTKYLLDSLKESEEDVKAGKVSPVFTNVKEASAWLNRRDDKTHPRLHNYAPYRETDSVIIFEAFGIHTQLYK